MALGRVLIISQGIDGGIAGMVRLLANSLSSSRWLSEIVFVGRSVSERTQALRSQEGRVIVTGPARSFAEVRGSVRALFALMREAKTFRPDIILLGGMVPALLYAPFLKVALQVPIVFWDHGRPHTFIGIKNILFRIVRGSITHQVSLSKFSRNYYIERLGSSGAEISVVENAVPVMRFFREDRPSFDELRIIMPARIDLIQKDPLTLIRVVAKLVAQGEKVTLDLAGDGPDMAEVASFIEHSGATAAIRLLGHIPDMSAILHRYNVTVLSSNFESFGLSLIEGMLTGHIVVGSNVVGITEVIRDGENGLLFQHANTAALSSVLLEILRSPEKASMLAEAGRQEAMERYRPERLGAEFDRILSRLLKVSEQRHYDGTLETN